MKSLHQLVKYDVVMVNAVSVTSVLLLTEATMTGIEEVPENGKAEAVEPVFK